MKLNWAKNEPITSVLLLLVYDNGGLPFDIIRMDVFCCKSLIKQRIANIRGMQGGEDRKEYKYLEARYQDKKEKWRNKLLGNVKNLDKNNQTLKASQNKD